MRECGLKSHKTDRDHAVHRVTPRAGVWIEMESYDNLNQAKHVTPRAGVWIEIRMGLD